MSENALLDSLNEVYIAGQLDTAKRIRETPKEEIEDIIFDGWSKTIEGMFEVDLGVGFQHNQNLLKKFKAATKEKKIELAKDRQWRFERFKEVVTELDQSGVDLP